MKIHLFGARHADHESHVNQHENLKYGTLFLIGAPAVILGSMYIVDTLFRWLWH
jgi:hypothetical protein